MVSGRSPSLWHWLILALMVISASSKEYICGGSPCYECSPPGKLHAPGVGIDLTMAYATAAIHFSNGTTRDLAKIDGSPEYRAAMRAITQDAPNIRNGLDSSMERVYFQDPTWRNPYPLNKYWKQPWAWWYNLLIWRRELVNGFYHQNPPEYFSDDWIRAITAMLSEVKSAAVDPIDPKLDFNEVSLSWPDALYGTRQIHEERFRLACYLAGLKSIRYAGTIVSKAALEYEGVDIYGDELSPAEPTTVLVISYNAASLGITLWTREVYNDLQPLRAIESPAYGADYAQYGDSRKYWAQAQDLMEDIIKGEPVDYVLLLGSHSQDPTLLNALKEVIDHHNNIQLSVMDRYLLPDLDLQQDKNRLLFYGARAAAAIARVGIETNFEYCWQPDWCILDEEEPVRYVRSEL
ncbi:hypothetical protein BJX63DRAFT_207085 [Aspergillus granulosus]|uniref:Uncharacterized protein n=1 Tax=Aspergillus granulosus TaxID=176169 RepID=A0ABR4HET1_9EURO